MFSLIKYMNFFFFFFLALIYLEGTYFSDTVAERFAAGGKYTIITSAV